MVGVSRGRCARKDNFNLYAQTLPCVRFSLGQWCPETGVVFSAVYSAHTHPGLNLTQRTTGNHDVYLMSLPQDETAPTTRSNNMRTGSEHEARVCCCQCLADFVAGEYASSLIPYGSSLFDSTFFAVRGAQSKNNDPETEYPPSQLITYE